MATNKPHFTIAKCSSISEGMKVTELHWFIPKFLIVESVKTVAFGLLFIKFTDGSWMFRRRTDKIFASR